MSSCTCSEVFPVASATMSFILVRIFSNSRPSLLMSEAFEMRKRKGSVALSSGMGKQFTCDIFEERPVLVRVTSSALPFNDGRVLKP